MSDFAKGIMAKQQAVIQRQKEADELILCNARTEITNNAEKEVVGFRLLSGTLNARTMALKTIIDEFKGLCKIYALVPDGDGFGILGLSSSFTTFPKDPKDGTELTMFVLDFKNISRDWNNKFVESLFG